MSIAHLKQAFKAKCGPTMKLVLLVLCDVANEQGECFPSAALIVERSGLSERAVRKALTDLENCSYLVRETRSGRANLYTVTPAFGAPLSCTTCTPAPAAPLHDVHPTPAPRAPTPAPAAPPPLHVVHPTPAPRAPITTKEPSDLTTTEPSREPSRAPKTPKPKPVEVEAGQLIEAGFSPEVADEFLAHKRGVKAPLTPRAWADHCREADRAGWTPQQAAEKVMARGWKGFEAKYVEGGRPGQPANKRQAVEDANRAAAEDFIARCL